MLSSPTTTTTTRAVPRLSPSLNRLATTAKRYKKSRIVLGSCPEPADRSDIAITVAIIGTIRLSNKKESSSWL